MTWDFHYHHSRKPKNVIYRYCFYIEIEIDITIDIVIAIAIAIAIAIDILFPSCHPLLHRGWGEDKKNPVSLEIGFQRPEALAERAKQR